MDSYFGASISYGSIAIPKFLLLGKLTYLLYRLDNMGDLGQNGLSQEMTSCKLIVQDLIDIGLLDVDETQTFGFSINYDCIAQQNSFSNNKMAINPLHKDCSDSSINKESNQTEKLRGTRKRIYRFMENALGRPLNFQEIDSVSEWVDCLEIEEDAVITILERHYEKGVLNIAYIEKVVHELIGAGKIDKIMIKEYFDKKFTEKSYEKEIADYLSLQRTLTGPEKKLIKSWFEEQKLTLEEVLAACDKTVVNRRPSLAHVNAILNGENDPVQVAGAKDASNPLNNSAVKKKRIKKAFEEYDEFS